MERSKLKTLLYAVYTILILIGLIIIYYSLLNPLDYYPYYGYSSTSFFNTIIVVFIFLVLLPGIVVAVLLKSSANEVLKQINAENNKVIESTRPEILLALMQIFQSPRTTMNDRMTLLKCVKCGGRGDLHEFTYTKQRSSSHGSYRTVRTMTIRVPICDECHGRFKSFQQISWIRYVLYCLSIIILFYAYVIAIQFIILAIVVIELVVLQHPNNRRKYMKFSYSSDKPKIKPEGKGVWIDFNDWIKFALCETAAIEGSEIEHFINSQQQQTPSYGYPYSSTPSPSLPPAYAPQSTPSYAQSTPSYAQPSPAAQGRTTKFCTKCGTEIAADSTFCGECGNKLEH